MLTNVIQCVITNVNWSSLPPFMNFIIYVHLLFSNSTSRFTTEKLLVLPQLQSFATSNSCRLLLGFVEPSSTRVLPNTGKCSLTLTAIKSWTFFLLPSGHSVEQKTNTDRAFKSNKWIRLPILELASWSFGFDLLVTSHSPLRVERDIGGCITFSSPGTTRAFCWFFATVGLDGCVGMYGFLVTGIRAPFPFSIADTASSTFS